MIEDILSCNYGIFTCDNTVISVPVTAPALNADIFSVVTPLRFFDKNDNIIIRGLSVDLPYAFISASQRFKVSLTGVYKAGGADFNLPQIGTTNERYLHSENIEVEENIYIPFSVSLTGDNWIIRGSRPAGYWNVSCLNAPAILNGVSLPVFCSIRIIHTLPMVL